MKKKHTRQPKDTAHARVERAPAVAQALPKETFALRWKEFRNRTQPVKPNSEAQSVVDMVREMREER